MAYLLGFGASGRLFEVANVYKNAMGPAEDIFYLTGFSGRCHVVVKEDWTIHVTPLSLTNRATDKAGEAESPGSSNALTFLSA